MICDYVYLVKWGYYLAKCIFHLAMFSPPGPWFDKLPLGAAPRVVVGVNAVFLAALGIVRNEADAEDVAQEAILKAFKNLGRFRQEAKFSTWLIQIAINEAKMRLRKDRRPLYESIEEGKLGNDGDYIPRDFADWREIPSEALEQKQLRRALTNALDSLPEKYRTILILRDVQQLSINETAKILGLSEAHVKTRLSRARLQMRDALAPGFDGAWRRERSYEKIRPF